MTEQTGEVSMIEAVRSTLGAIMEDDERVVVLGEDVAGLGGVFRATDGLVERFGEDRVVDTPMAELSIAGIAIGMAMRGLRPIAEFQFGEFIYAATDQILNEAAKIRYRSAGEWTVPLVIRATWGAGIHGALYHSQSIEAVFSHFPGLKVVAASTPADAAGLLLSAVADPDPVMVLEHKLAYRRAHGPVPDPPQPVPIGPCRVAREGTSATVFAYGWMLHETLRAADRLAEEDGVELHVVDLRTLSPLDRDGIEEAARRTGRVCVVHEDTRSLGLGAEVSSIVHERCFDVLEAPVARVTMPDVAGIPYAAELESALMPDADDVVEAVRELLQQRRLAPAGGHAGGNGQAAPASRPGAPASADLPPAYHDPSAPQASMTMPVRLDDAQVGEDLLPRLVAAAAGALVAEPEANWLWHDEGLLRRDEIHIAVVEADERGRRRELVVAHPDRLSERGVSQALQDARNGVADPRAAAPTFTLISPGGPAAFGIPRVPPGQTAAVQVGAVEHAVVARDGGIAVAPQVWLALSADHRMLDGAGAARFLGAVKAGVETREGAST